MPARRAAVLSTLTLALALLAPALLLAACGGAVRHPPRRVVPAPRRRSNPTLGFPQIATKNTTRIASTNPVVVAAAVALAVFPSAAAGTHPAAVALAPTGDWEAAIAASSLMAPPFDAPILLSGPGSLPRSTRAALTKLAPTGARALSGAQVVRIGEVPAVPGALRSVAVTGSSPYALAAAIDRLEAARAGHYSSDVVIASAAAPAYAMPAAGYAAESGDPVLFVGAGGVPAATAQALLAAHRPHIYVLGPASVIPAATLGELAAYGKVARIDGTDPASNSVAFTEYRDPPCAYGQPCVHVPGSFGWAIRSPGHGYVLIPESDTLDAAAASALSASGSYGPQLLMTDPNNLPSSVLNYFLNYATPGYTGEGPTAAVYNHAWLVGGPHAISLAVQAQVDGLLEAVPQQ